MLELDLPQEIILLIAAIFGAVFGSFATALIYRMPRELNWVSKRSFCPTCEKPLGFLDLFPIFSYIFSKGKCRKCKTPISARYISIELLVCLSFVLSFALHGATQNAIIISLLSFATIVLSAIDFEHYIIPDEVNIFILLLGIWYGLINDKEFLDILIACAVSGLFSYSLRFGMYLWKKKEALGLGDVKFFFAIGGFLSLDMFSTFLLLSGLIGILIAIIWKITNRGKLFPFGPALSISLLFCVAFPEYRGFLTNQMQYILVESFFMHNQIG